MQNHKYIPYNLKLKSIASDLRKNQTQSEILVWKYLKDNFSSLTFNRQKPLDEFIVDFYCSELSLIIEVDGEIHNYQKEKDLERDNIFLQKYSIKTIRITNKEVMENINILKERMYEAIPSLIKEG